MQRKFMFTLENRKVFQKTKVTDSKIEYESVLTWSPVSPQLRYEVYHTI